MSNLRDYQLETERLILRPMENKDIDDLYEYNSDTQNTKYMYALSVNDGETFPYETTFSYLQQVIQEWQKENKSFYEFAIEYKKDGKMIGNIRVSVSEDGTYVTLGWILNRKFHKNGFALEAAKEILLFVFFRLGISKVFAQCDEKNIASSNLMKRLGMKLYASGEYRKYPNTGVESTEATYIIEKKNFV